MNRKILRRLALLAVASGAIGLAPMGAHAYVAATRTIPGGLSIVRAVDPSQAGCSVDATADSWGSKTATINNPCDVRIFLDQPYNAQTDPSQPVTDGSETYEFTVTRNNVNITASGTVRGADISGDPTSPDLTLLPGNDTIIWTPSAALADGAYKVHLVASGVDDVNGRAPGKCDAGPGQTGCYELKFTVASTPVTPAITSDLAPDHLDYIVEGTAEPLSKVTLTKNGDAAGTVTTDSTGVFKVKNIALSPWGDTLKVDATSKALTTREVAATDTPPTLTTGDVAISPAYGPDGDAPTVTVLSTDSAIGGNEVTGTSEDNIGVTGYTVSVHNDVTGEVMTEGADTYQVSSSTGPFGSWTVHFSGPNPGKWDVDVIASDAAGNTSDPAEGVVSVIVTTGDGLI